MSDEQQPQAKSPNRTALVAALASLLSGAGAFLAARATAAGAQPMHPPAQVQQQQADAPSYVAYPPAALANEISLLRGDMRDLGGRLDTLNQRLSHLEGAWDAQRAGAKRP